MFSGRLWELFIDSFPKILIPGLTVTIPLTVISFTFALIIAVIMALVQFANVKVLKQIARFYIWIFRGTPLLVQLFVVFFGLSRIGILLDPFPAAVIVFSLNEGAYCAETIRAALESVPKGQLEAGQCVGLTYLQTIFRIVLPLGKSAMATIAIMGFIASWNSYLWPLIITNSMELRTVQTGLRSLMTLDQGVEWNQLMAMSALITLPIIALFVALQRYFVQGVTKVGIK